MTIFSELFKQIREKNNNSRQCIGCKCCKVPWNQGSDYCDKCIEDDKRQLEPGYKLHAEPINYARGGGPKKESIREEEEDEFYQEGGDIASRDDEHWYQYGKLYFTGDRLGLKVKMDKDKFWPNVFTISDHGNSILLSGTKNWWWK